MIERDLKPGWRRVKFGDVVRLSKARSQDPLADGIERYVGLEHLEPGDLRIRSWGNVADGVTFTSVFQPGQVLFGKRRAYQRKVAVADFSGVCSGDIYVLETKDPKVLLPELLPFICQTDDFFDHAVGTSAGSLSPRTNWTSLAEFELLLPTSLTEQAALLELLSALQGSIDAISEGKRSAEIALEAFLTEVFGAIPEVTPLQTMCRPIVRGIDSPGPEVEGGVPYVRIAEMTGPEGIRLANLKRTSQRIADSYPESRLDEGDIVVALRGVVGMPVRTPAEAAGANLSRGTARVSVLNHCVPDYVFWALRSPRVRKEVLRFATGWKGEDLREITLTELRALSLPSVERAQQKQIAETAESLSRAVAAMSERCEAARELMKVFLERVLSGGSRVH